MKRWAVLTAICFCLLVASESFQISPASRPHHRVFMSENEPDLFEYFDPLLSPHAYPNGISLEAKPLQQTPAVSNFGQQSIKNDPPIDFVSPIESVSVVDYSPQQSEQSPCLDQDFFDPLLSPHSYPNGTPDKVLADLSTPAIGATRPSETFEIVGSADFPSFSLAPSVSAFDRPPSAPTTELSSSLNLNAFDPLLSPHMYPNGTPDTVLADLSMASSVYQSETDDGIEPLDPVHFISLLSSVTTMESTATHHPPSSQQDALLQRDDEMNSIPEVFDPLLSPHMYPNGTPNRVIGPDIGYDNGENNNDKKRVGILLMDHGSRNQGSNDRLHEIARIYQKSVDAEQFIVTAAHMELASPSIPEGLKYLLDQNVQEIVCHPYFLSAQGRHVSQDIPEILNNAIEQFEIEIPIVTTEPVGSLTDIMIEAIQSLVQQKSSIINK